MLFLEDSSTILYDNYASFLEDSEPVAEESSTLLFENEPSLLEDAEPTIGKTIDFTADPIADNVEVLALATSDSITIQGSPIIYVRQGFAGGGTSWADAYGDLQTAIANAPAGSEIWVAAGTYVPTGTGDRNISFALRDALEIYGGFSGVESDRSQRNTGANQTILSGDIGTPGNNTDNSYHVVTALNIPNYAILDGFTITGGNANANLRDTTVPLGANGGGILSQFSVATFSNLFITGNTARTNGGAAYIDRVQNQFINVVVTGNSASFGGGFYINGTTTNPPNSTVAITNSTFSQNSATNDGGAIRSFRTTLTIFGSVFDRNTAGQDGGAIRLTASSQATATNSSFSNNVAAERGGAIYGGLTTSYSIVWGNQAPTDSQIGDNSAVSNSIVQGGLTVGSNIINADPLFVDAASGNLALQASSPAINQGNNAAVPSTVSTDIVGNPRISGGTVDLGAYEFFAFDAAQYGASNPDLIPVFGADLAGLTNHYLLYGRFEGRQTDTFDEFRYTASNADLIGAFGLDGNAATLHYLTNGFLEGRSTTSFIPARYILSYDDLLGFYTVGGTQHYISSGFSEGRNPNLFASDRYIASYGDLIQAYSYNLEAGSNHYLFSGRGEGRQISFNPASYLALNPDVAAAFNNDPTLATQHYILFGFSEGRPIA